MIYGYTRVSTKGQLDGNSLEKQEKEILDRYENARIYKEQFTGSTTERPVFNELLNQLDEDDVLVVSKLDRFCRTAKEGLILIDKLMGQGIKIHILNMGLIEDTAMGRMIITNLLAFAEFERNMIIERTQSGKDTARTKSGFREGRPPKFTDEQIKHALKLLKDHSYKQVEKMTKISISTLKRAKRKQKEEGNN